MYRSSRTSLANLRHLGSVLLLAAGIGVGTALVFPNLAAAQGLGLTRSDTPVKISAEKGVEWNKNEKTYIARGNATATQGDNQVKADVLRAHYRKETDGKTRIWKMTATGNVVITTKNETITGGQATYQVKAGIFVLVGGNLKMTSKKRVITASRRIEYRSKQKVAYVIGNATATEDDKKVRADRFIAYLESAGDKTKMRRVEARGNVIITTATEVARGDKASYDTKTEIATLTGNVRLTRGDNQLNGAKAVVNMKTGVSNIVAAKGKPITGLFTPRDDSDDDKPKKSKK